MKFVCLFPLDLAIMFPERLRTNVVADWEYEEIRFDSIRVIFKIVLMRIGVRPSISKINHTGDS